jgi:hypothetical protein
MQDIASEKSNRLFKFFSHTMREEYTLQLMKIRKADEAQREDDTYHQAKADWKKRANKREGAKLRKRKS